jgi:hypothetical protein
MAYLNANRHSSALAAGDAMRSVTADAPLGALFQTQLANHLFHLVANNTVSELNTCVDSSKQ